VTISALIFIINLLALAVAIRLRS